MLETKDLSKSVSSVELKTLTETDDKKSKSTKPSDSNFTQQRLPSWHMRFSIRTFYPYFLGIGFILLFLGLLQWFYHFKIQEHVNDYTDCSNNQSIKCSSVNFSTPCTCQVEFELLQDSNSQVYLYYGLTNFYQSHSKFMRSKDIYQLMGSSDKGSKSCLPYWKDANSKVYAPCGAMANFIFNDTFYLVGPNGAVNMTSKGIAWASDKTKKYGKPKNWDNTVKPENWKTTAFERNGYDEDEELMVWMRPAATKDFRKLHRILLNDLTKGKYVMTIEYNYPVIPFGGTKSFILCTKNWTSGISRSLIITYLVVGTIHFTLGLTLAGIYFIKRIRAIFFTRDI